MRTFAQLRDRYGVGDSSLGTQTQLSYLIPSELLRTEFWAEDLNKRLVTEYQYKVTYVTDYKPFEIRVIGKATYLQKREIKKNIYFHPNN